MGASQLKKIKRLIYFTYLLGAAALAVLAGAGYGSFRSLLEKDHWVDHTRQVMYSAEKVISLLKDTQIGQRGYIITGDSIYLGHYFSALDSLSGQMSLLQRLTADNASQQRRIDTIHRMIGQHKTLLARTIEQRTVGNEAALVSHFAKQRGKVHMDQMRQVIADIIGEENQLLAARIQKLNAAMGQAKLMGLAVVGLMFLFAVFLFGMLRGQFHRKEAYEQALHEKNQELGTLNEELAASNEELAAINEELQAANEEVLSGNEELVAVNEALEESQAKLLLLNEELERRVGLRTNELEEANVELRLGEQQLSFLTEFIPQLVWRSRKDGSVEYFNQRWYEFTGQSRSEAIPGSFEGVIHPEDYPRILKQWRHALRTGTTYHTECRLRKANGEYHWFLNRALPQRDEQGNILNWYGTCTDIHEQKTAQQAFKENQALLHTLATASPATLWLSDQTGGISYVNQTWVDWTGRPLEAHLGDGWSLSIIEEDRAGAAQKYRSDFEARRHFLMDFRITHRDGAEHWCIAEGVPRYSITGEFAGYVGSCIDITDRKRSEQEQDRTLRELNRTLQELTRLNVDLDNFVYTASHDLRSPIANLEGLQRVMAKRLASRLDHAEQEMMGLMEQSVGRLKRAIKELSEIAKIQKETQQPREELSFRQVVREVSQDIAPLITEASPQVVLALEVEEIYFPGKHLRSVFYNLLSNALKYRSPDRSPVIVISTRNEEGGVHLSVSDNGLGLTESQVGKLFFMFKRLHTHVEGTGVGLYTVKRIVENYGGRIWVESQPDVGTTFHLHFTTGQPAPSPAALGMDHTVAEAR
jgi:PAS domain S-box-containing protein